MIFHFSIRLILHDFVRCLSKMKFIKKYEKQDKIKPRSWYRNYVKSFQTNPLSVFNKAVNFSNGQADKIAKSATEKW